MLASHSSMNFLLQQFKVVSYVVRNHCVQIVHPAVLHKALPYARGETYIRIPKDRLKKNFVMVWTHEVRVTGIFSKPNSCPT